MKRIAAAIVRCSRRGRLIIASAHTRCNAAPDSIVARTIADLKVGTTQRSAADLKVGTPEIRGDLKVGTPGIRADRKIGSTEIRAAGRHLHQRG